jgi:hypothetical protein
MKRILLLLTFFLFLTSIHAQEKKQSSPDDLLKESIYSSNKKVVMNFTMKDFDALFFEFFQKKADNNSILTKEEFYTYTIKIAIFSDRLGTLYPAEKKTAEESKKKWFAESYEDYLLSKQKPK